MDNTLFLGNGIFRLKTECEKKIGCEGRDKSWGDLLSEISFAAQDAFNANLPMPVEYDRILASIERKRDALESYYAVDGRNDAWKRILAEDDLPCAVKRYIAGWFNERGYCPPEILGNVLKLQFDHVLTSNYDLRIENHLKQNPTVAPQLHGQVEHVHGSIE